MLLSESINVLTRDNALIKDWALKRISRTPIISMEYKVTKIERVLSKYKAIIIIAFLLLAQFALYDFDIAEYTATSHYGAIELRK